MFPIVRALTGILLFVIAVTPVRAQNGFDRPGGDYARFVVPSGDPAVCAARCDREGRCRAWTFSYPGQGASGGTTSAVCWLKSEVKPAVENNCCVSGIKGAALVEAWPGPVENAVNRFGGDYRNVEVSPDPTGEACKKLCEGENRCRAWTYVRPGYQGAQARCYLKSQIKPPRRSPCCLSGVVR